MQNYPFITLPLFFPSGRTGVIQFRFVSLLGCTHMLLCHSQTLCFATPILLFVIFKPFCYCLAGDPGATNILADVMRQWISILRLIPLSYESIYFLKCTSLFFNRTPRQHDASSPMIHRDDVYQIKSLIFFSTLH